MKKLTRILLCSIFICSLFAYPISVQGVLRDGNNRSVEDGTYSMEFLIYNESSGGSSVWNSGLMDVDVFNGVYSETLDIDNNIYNSANLWLEVQIDNNAMSRVELHLSPYEQSIVSGQTNVFPSAENVGIGTASPTSQLHVYNGLNEDPSSTNNAITKERAAIQISGGGTGTDLYLGVGTGGQNTWIQAQHEDANEKNILINPIGGNVGIGMNSGLHGILNNTPQHLLDVNGQIGALGIKRRPTGGTNDYIYIQSGYASNYTNSEIYLYPFQNYYCSNDHYFVNSHNSSGTTMYVNGSVVHGSDDRLKLNEKNVNNALNVIRRLNPQTYDRADELNSLNTIKDTSGKTSKEVGFIAQEILEIPELEHAVISGDSKGNGSEQQYYVNYREIFSYSVAALKELDQKNSDLETKVSELENTIQALENKINNILNEE